MAVPAVIAALSHVVVSGVATYGILRGIEGMQKERNKIAAERDALAAAITTEIGTPEIAEWVQARQPAPPTVAAFVNPEMVDWYYVTVGIAPAKTEAATAA
jgi:hypothetical protein